MTHYEILDLQPDCSYTDIKRNYRKLVKRYHPDINPSVEAKKKIVEITAAYEILSDPSSRNTYDWQIDRPDPTDSHSTANRTHAQTYEPDPVEEIVDPYEEAKREHLRKRRKQEQEAWERKFKILALFYKIQRRCAIFFLIAGLVFTADYWIQETEGPYSIQDIKEHHGLTYGKFMGHDFVTDEGLYWEVTLKDYKKGYLHRSGIFSLTMGLSVSDIGTHLFRHTLYWYKNFFAYLLIFLAGMLITYKRYNDFMLTMGIIPFFIFLLYCMLMMNAAH